MENISGSITHDLRKQTGIDVGRCYQCGKCSAGCVQAEEMDYPPNMIVHLLQYGTQANLDKVLRSKSIWLCLNCENCVGRCPMEIDIPSLMDYLRERSLKEKKQNKAANDIIAFHKSFLDSVRSTGHLYEVGLVASFKARTLHLWQDVKLVPKMLSKGKLQFLPEMVKDMHSIKGIFSKTKK